MMEDKKKAGQIEDMLRQSGLLAGPINFQSPLQGGNNQIQAFEMKGKKYVIKRYLTDPNDARSRLQTEWLFLKYANEIGVACVPKPLCYDEKSNLGLYSFIDGNKISPGHVSGHHIDQAALFISALNAPSKAAIKARTSNSLNDASEACFSIRSHFVMIEKRLSILGDIIPDSRVNENATIFVTELLASWYKVKERIITHCQRENVSIDSELATEERCISPSDFGFHNAIEDAQGELSFIDFEYAGWDDPAKLICDFFLQPAVSVSRDFYHRFVDRWISQFPEPAKIEARTAMLEPLFAIKWCCIILNPFRPNWIKGRHLDMSEAELENLREQQMYKAARVHNTLSSDILQARQG